MARFIKRSLYFDFSKLAAFSTGNRKSWISPLYVWRIWAKLQPLSCQPSIYAIHINWIQYQPPNQRAYLNSWNWQQTLFFCCYAHWWRAHSMLSNGGTPVKLLVHTSHCVSYCCGQGERMSAEKIQSAHCLQQVITHNFPAWINRLGKHARANWHTYATLNWMEIHYNAKLLTS